MKLFVYGELCKLEVLRRVIGRVPGAVPALLMDHRRRRAEHGHFEIFPAPGGRVAGLVLDVGEDDLPLLDRFEDVDAGVYRRASVRVCTLGPDAADLDADAYLAGDETR